MLSKIIPLEKILIYAAKANQYVNQRMIKRSMPTVSTVPLKHTDLYTGSLTIVIRDLKEFETIPAKLAHPLQRCQLINFFEKHLAYATKYNVGNCLDFALLAFDYLLNFVEEDLRIELFQMGGEDHNVLVLNRNRVSDPTDPLSWGENAVICDPWAKLGYGCYQALLYEPNLQHFTSIEEKHILESEHEKPTFMLSKYNLNTDLFHHYRTIDQLKANFKECCVCLGKLLHYTKYQLHKEQHINAYLDFTKTIQLVDLLIAKIKNNDVDKRKLREYRAAKKIISNLLISYIQEIQACLSINAEGIQKSLAGLTRGTYFTVKNRLLYMTQESNLLLRQMYKSDNQLYNHSNNVLIPSQKEHIQKLRADFFSLTQGLHQELLNRQKALETSMQKASSPEKEILHKKVELLKKLAAELGIGEDYLKIAYQQYPNAKQAKAAMIDFICTYYYKTLNLLPFSYQELLAITTEKASILLIATLIELIREKLGNLSLPLYELKSIDGHDKIISIKLLGKEFQLKCANIKDLIQTYVKQLQKEENNYFKKTLPSNLLQRKIKESEELIVYIDTVSKIEQTDLDHWLAPADLRDRLFTMYKGTLGVLSFSPAQKNRLFNMDAKKGMLFFDFNDSATSFLNLAEKFIGQLEKLYGQYSLIIHESLEKEQLNSDYEFALRYAQLI